MPPKPPKHGRDGGEDSASKRAKNADTSVEHTEDHGNVLETETLEPVAEHTTDADQVEDAETKNADTTNVETTKSDSDKKQSVLPVVKSYSKELKARIQAISAHVDKEAWIFNIKHIPSGLKFAQVEDPPRGKGYYLVDPSTRKIITIWVPGKVTFVSLGQKNKTPPNTANVTIAPLDPEDDAKSTALIDVYSNEEPGKASKSDLTLHDGVRASCWMNYKGEGEDEASPKAFTDIYDATTKLAFPRSAMKTLTATDIELDDLVLLEVRVSRYSQPIDGAASGSPSKKDWKHWKATYNLTSVYLLKKHDPQPTASDSKSWAI